MIKKRHILNLLKRLKVLKNRLIDNYKGCLVGLAIGDALGATIEFRKPGTFKPIADMIGGGPHNLKKGEWTDDTSMALCLANSLIEKQTFDPIDQLEKYVIWYRKGYMSSTGRCFDIGNTTKTALLVFEKTHKSYCGFTDRYSAGNGSIMRLVPVPLFYLFDPMEAIEKSGESSKTTHGALETVDACRYMGGLIVGALLGCTKEELLSEKYSPVQNYWNDYPLCTEIDEIAKGSFKYKNPPEIVGSGYVVKSLEAALWAFYNSSSFEEGCLRAINLGDDSDTTGAVYGQIAGAYYGACRIPKRWVNKLAKYDLIISMATRLAD